MKSMTMLYFVLVTLAKILAIILPLLISIAYFTLIERKILGAIQRRRGPNVVGTYGLLQPLADGFKLLVKETIVPSNSNRVLFIISPMIFFTASLISWGVIPFNKYSYLAELNISMLYLYGTSSIAIYGVIMSGWASNSKYSFLGALRSSAQMISYEISIGFIMLTIATCVGSYNINEIIFSQRDVWFITLFSPLFLIFFISGLAETNRHPFDLPEAEAELVSGYNVEYSAMGFALFSLAEYSNMLLMSAMNVILFFGGWSSPFYYASTAPNELYVSVGFSSKNWPLFTTDTFALWFGFKICIFVILFIVARAILPRYRYDQLMNLGWKVFLPVSIAYFIFTSFILYAFDMGPY